MNEKQISIIFTIFSIGIATNAQPSLAQDNITNRVNIAINQSVESDTIISQNIPTTVPTPPSTGVNPRPSIFNEPPYNRVQTSNIPAVPIQTKPPITPPLPENRSQAIAKIMLMDGKINVRIKNNTNAVVSYEAIQYAERRFLPGGEEIVLQDLPTPVTITLVRQDKGLLDVLPVATSAQGTLEVSLNEAKNLGDNQGTLRIQRDGQVFLN